MKATLTVERALPRHIVERVRGDGGLPPVSMYYEDKEAEAFLRAGVGNAERELDSYAAKLGMKPRDDQSTEYGFGGDDCWYQRSYRK